MAALDEDFDHEDPENELDDDFMAQAMASGDEEDGDEDAMPTMDRVAQFAAEQRYFMCKLTVFVNSYQLSWA